MQIMRVAKAEMDRAQKAYSDEQARLLAAGVDSKARRQALAPLRDAYLSAEFNFKSVRRVCFAHAVDEMMAQRG